MISKPSAKPTVLDWLNPLANGRLTIRQDNTRQDKVGFGSLNQNQNPPFVLVGLTDKQGFLSCFFFPRADESAKTRVLARLLSTSFQQRYPQSRERRCA